MFSAKNYGLPKDLIEAAKRVHEKQLEENLDKSIKKPKNKDPDFTKLSKALNPAFEKIKNQTNEDLKSEEVQFTEEELAEAFAIFLEENFHVEMLTEEDLDYVFEEEFPQWLEEEYGPDLLKSFKVSDTKYNSNQAIKPGVNKSRNKRKTPFATGTGRRTLDPMTGALGDAAGTGRRRTLDPMTGGLGDAAGKGRSRTSTPQSSAKLTQTGYEGDLKGANEIAKRAATPDAFKSDTLGGRTSAPTPAVRKKVSSRPAAQRARVRKRTGGLSLFQRAKKAVRPTPGDSGRTAIDRLRYMAGRGNKASQEALRGPKKDWRSTVFSNAQDGN